MTEPCKYENLMGQMAADISNIKDDQAETKETTGKIFNTLDGKGGLVTETALNKQSITRLWRFGFIICAGLIGFALKSLAG